MAALDLEEQLKIFYASSPQNKHVIKVLQVGHSAMSQTFYLWREPYTGQVTLEDDSLVNVTPLNMDMRISLTDQTLDNVFEFTLDTTHVDDTFRSELDSIPLETEEKIVAVYREYLSDNLTEPLAVITLQVESISYNKGAATMSAVTPRLNVTRTGALYTYGRFPMLRGFI